MKEATNILRKALDIDLNRHYRERDELRKRRAPFKADKPERDWRHRPNMDDGSHRDHNGHIRHVRPDLPASTVQVGPNSNHKVANPDRVAHPDAWFNPKEKAEHDLLNQDEHKAKGWDVRPVVLPKGQFDGVHPAFLGAHPRRPLHSRAVSDAFHDDKGPYGPSADGRARLSFTGDHSHWERKINHPNSDWGKLENSVHSVEFTPPDRHYGREHGSGRHPLPGGPYGVLRDPMSKLNTRKFTVHRNPNHDPNSSERQHKKWSLSMEHHNGAVSTSAGHYGSLRTAIQTNQNYAHITNVGYHDDK
jgi:hypothetical protein